MSVYVGIDVHRKRSQVAVVAEDGTVELNKNVVNGSEPMLRLIGDLPAGTPVAFEAAFGWGWLVGLLEDYVFDPHLVHPLRTGTGWVMPARTRTRRTRRGAAVRTSWNRTRPPRRSSRECSRSGWPGTAPPGSPALLNDARVPCPSAADPGRIRTARVPRGRCGPSPRSWRTPLHGPAGAEPAAG
jgi:hypothetical protein